MWIIKFNGEFYKKFYQTRSRFLFGLKVFARLVWSIAGKKCKFGLRNPTALKHDQTTINLSREKKYLIIVRELLCCAVDKWKPFECWHEHVTAKVHVLQWKCEFSTLRHFMNFMSYFEASEFLVFNFSRAFFEETNTPIMATLSVHTFVCA